MRLSTYMRTALRPQRFAPYVGFTEAEVESLAERYGMDMTELCHWYDGYELRWNSMERDGGHRRELRVRAYAPFSVMNACTSGQVGSYWTSSEAFTSLKTYIDLDFDGLQQAIVQVLGGATVPVRTGKFLNDMHAVESADDVLTLLCHLGYLAYDEDTHTARIPNEEVRAELTDAMEESHHAEIARIVRESDQLLMDTWDLDAEAVCTALQSTHDNGCAPAFYNNEQALRAVVKSAYICAAGHYATIDELPSGRGVADVVFVPKRGVAAPAMVVELKWNRTPQAALAQIRKRDYPAILRDWGGPTILVDVTYDPKTKEHHCQLEKL